MEHFEYVNRYDIERAGNQYEKPCNIGVFTAKKINDWINYYTQIYRQVEQENVENSKKVADFLKSIENERKMGREQPFKRDDNPQRLALHFLHRGRTPLF